MEKPKRVEVQTGLPMLSLYHKSGKFFFPKTHFSAVRNSRGETLNQLLKCYEERIDHLEEIAINSGTARADVFIVDNAYTNSGIRALSARQGKELLDSMAKSHSLELVKGEGTKYGTLELKVSSIMKEMLDEETNELLDAVPEIAAALEETDKALEETNKALEELGERVTALEKRATEHEEAMEYHKEMDEYILRILHEQVHATIDLKAYDEVEGEWVSDSIDATHILMDGLKVRVNWKLYGRVGMLTPEAVEVYQLIDGEEILLSDSLIQTTFERTLQNLAEALSIDVKVVCHYGYITFEATKTMLINR